MEHTPQKKLIRFVSLCILHSGDYVLVTQCGNAFLILVIYCFIQSNMVSRNYFLTFYAKLCADRDNRSTNTIF